MIAPVIILATGLADVVGSSVLTFSGVTASLGWVMGVSSMVVFCYLGYYCAVSSLPCLPAFLLFDNSVPLCLCAFCMTLRGCPCQGCPCLPVLVVLLSSLLLDFEQLPQPESKLQELAERNSRLQVLMSRARTMIEESTGTSPGSMGETSRALLGDKAASWTYLIVYGIFAFLVPPCCTPLRCRTVVLDPVVLDHIFLLLQPRLCYWQTNRNELPAID